MTRLLKTQDPVLQLEDAIASELVLVDLPVEHFFSDGLYARQLLIPKGVVLTGKAHKRDHLNFLLKGKIAVMADKGVQVLDAPAIIPSFAGVKRAGYAIEESIWVTVHATDTTELVELEEELVEPSRPHIQEAANKALSFEEWKKLNLLEEKAE
jgi:hypothetical protein